MYKFEKFVRLLNFVFTKTIDERAAFNKNYDLSYRRIHYNNCYSLKNILDLFIFTHNKFKEEYDNLDKFDLGKVTEFEFTNLYNKDGYYRRLETYINNPSFIDLPDINLIMHENDGEIKCFITDEDYNDIDYIYNKISLSDEKVKGYLDLFEKYQPFLEFYKKCHNSLMVRGDLYCLYICLNSKSENVLDDIDKMSFYISVGSKIINDNSIYISYDLKNDSIDLSSSSVLINKRKYKLNENEFLNLLSSIYVSKDNINKDNFFDNLLELKEQLEKENEVGKQKTLTHN